MSTQTTFDLNGLSRAIQSRNCRYQLALYADDAEVEIVDGPRVSTPPHVLRGKPAIGQWLESMSSEAVGYRVRDAVGSAERVRFTEECVYPDGTELVIECQAEVRRGQIRHAAVTVLHPSPATRRDKATRAGSATPSLARNLPGNFLG